MTSINNKSTRRTLVLMLVLTVLPILMATLFYLNPQWISSYKNYGTLIMPPIQLKKSDLKALGAFSEQHADELDDRWLMIHVIPENVSECDESCQLAIHHSRQLWLMLNQNLMRLRRVLAVSNPKTGAKAALEIDDEYLLYVVGNNDLFNSISKVIPSPVRPGTVVLRDPLGNVMLWYKPDFDPYKVKKDLSRLFRTSRVG